MGSLKTEPKMGDRVLSEILTSWRRSFFFLPGTTRWHKLHSTTVQHPSHPHTRRNFKRFGIEVQTETLMAHDVHANEELRFQIFNQMRLDSDTCRVIRTAEKGVEGNEGR